MAATGLTAYKASGSSALYRPADALALLPVIPVPPHVIINPGDHHSLSSQYSDRGLVVLLETENEVSYRNTSSAILDTSPFPFLSSKPIETRLL